MTDKHHATLGPNPLALPKPKPKFQDRLPEYAAEDANGNTVVPVLPDTVHTIHTVTVMPQPPVVIPKPVHDYSIVAGALLALLVVSVLFNIKQRRRYDAERTSLEWELASHSAGSIRNALRRMQAAVGEPQPNAERIGRPRDRDHQHPERVNAFAPRRVVLGGREGTLLQDQSFHPEGSPLEAFARARQLASRQEDGS